MGPLVQLAARRSNAGPRGAHADLLQRVHEIFGPLPVIDAREPLTLHPLPIDAEGAKPRDPGNCMLAHCAARELGARTVAFFRGTTYLDRIGPDGERRIERYMNSAAARRLIVAFDSGTQPITADTTLTLLPPYKQFTIADKRARSRKFDQTPAGRARTELSHARTALRKRTPTRNGSRNVWQTCARPTTARHKPGERSSVGKKAGRELPNGSSRSPSDLNAPNRR